MKNTGNLSFTPFIVIALYCSCLISTSAFAAQKVVIIGDENYAPYSYVDGKKAKGVYIDIFKAIFDQLEDYDVSIRMMPWKRGLLYVKKGWSFAIFPPYYWPVKRPYIAPYSEPILLEKVVVVCNPDILEKPRPQWPNDYLGLNIGTNRGFLSPGPDFFSAAKQGKVNLIETENTQAGLQMLLLKRIDCYVNSKIAIQWNLKKIEREDTYHLKIDSLKFGVTISQQWAYLGYTAKNKEAFKFKADFQNKVDIIIREMKSKGEIEKIVHEFLNK